MKSDRHDLKENGWERKAYPIATISGTEQVEGMVKRCMGVREQCSVHRGHHEFWWVVEHVPSGRRMWVTDDQTHAFNFAQECLNLPEIALLEVADGKKTEEPLLSKLKEIRNRYSDEGRGS